MVQQNSKYYLSTSLRTATSTMEVFVAISLLIAASALVGAFVHQVQSGLRDRELSTRCDWELMNAREQIGSWPPERISVEQIQQMPLSDSLSTQLAKAYLTASIQNIEKPMPAKQVTLAIECDLHGQIVQPSILTFWVPSSAETNTEANP
jgi:hypothetical protein